MGTLTCLRRNLHRSFELGATIIGAGIRVQVPDLQRRLERDVLSKTYIGIYLHRHQRRVALEPNKGTKKDVFGVWLILSVKLRQSDRELYFDPTVIGEKTDGSNKFDSMLEEYSSISRGAAKATGSQLLDLRKSLSIFESLTPRTKIVAF